LVGDVGSVSLVLGEVVFDGVRYPGAVVEGPRFTLWLGDRMLVALNRSLIEASLRDVRKALRKIEALP